MMKPRATPFDPRRLDVRAFAAAGAGLEGEVRADELPRLWGELVQDPSRPVPTVRWALRGLERVEPGGARQTWVELNAEAEVPLVCQRCLEPVVEPLRVERQFQFVRDEAEAERLDAEVEHEVLAISRELDLPGLIEDELLLALPLVPRHADCQVLAEQPAAGPERVSGAFAALGALRRTVR